MITKKTTEEIEKMRQGGKLLSSALKAGADMVAPGVFISEIDKVIEQAIIASGGKPSFKGYQPSGAGEPFPSTVCVSINDEVVHGTAEREVQLTEGDIVSLDVGAWFEGLCTDMSVTLPVGKIDDKTKKLLETTKECLLNTKLVIKPGNAVSDIGRVIEETAKPGGYGIVRSLVGHGVGYDVHEDPQIPNYYNSNLDKIKLEPGMTLAIEPMITMGTDEILTGNDGWALATVDGSLSAHFEFTVAVTDGGCEILTPLFV